MTDLKLDHVDAGREFDWGRTSEDYDRHRPGPPDSFYRRLNAMDIGVPGQRILDIGTGTGLLARRFAKDGAEVSGTDIAEGQVQMARAAAEREGLDINFHVAPSHELPFADDTFDVITANQCWIYFDAVATMAEARRLLRGDGVLVISHFSFLPRKDPIVAASEALVLEHNPDWNGADWHGRVPVEPKWARPLADLVGFFVYEEQIPFTRESWRGRMRALRGIGAALSQPEIDAFDEAHDALLKEIAGETFDILHGIDAHIYRPKADPD